MHEMGIILHMANMLDETAKEQNLTKIGYCEEKPMPEIGIGSVTLEVGEVSGIMTDLFVDCWNYFKVKHPVLAESELKLVTIPAVTFCGSCGKTYETVRYGKECPFCHSGETWLEALDEELDSNDGWTASEDNEMFYRGRRLLDKQGAPVDATTKVDDTKQYQLEAEAQPAPDSDVTPVTPE